MSEPDEFELQKQWVAMPGYKIYQEMTSLGTSFSIFVRNQDELFLKLRQLEAPESARAFGLGNKRGLEAEFCEVIRLVHNYVASVMSLRDHTLRIARRLLGTQYRAYETRAAEEFRDDPVTNFLQDLRNYLLHYSHAPVKRVHRWPNMHTAPTVSIELPRQELLAWSGWAALSRQFIKKQDRDIILAPILVEYGARVRRFYVWLQDFIDTTRKADLQPFWAKHNEWAAYCREKGVPITDEEWREWLEAERSKRR